MIEMHGGKDAVVQAIWQSNPTEIKALQGKEVTTEKLDRIRAIQDQFENWPRESGYLDYVTDDRSPIYWRPYVGQASDASIRIHQHLTAAEKKKRTTLHYYIVSEGGKFRAMNYIRLWSLPSELVADQNAKQPSLLLNNVLEAVMCFAFPSLRPSDLEFHLGKACYATTGLNVLPPFLQGVSLDIPTRTSYINKCLDSEDEEIRRWPIERKKQRDVSRSISNNRRAAYQGYRRQSHYWKALEQAIQKTKNCDNFTWRQHSQGPCATSFNNLLQLVEDLPDRPLVRPFGSFAALIGVILDPCPVSRTENRGNLDENITAIPSALTQANFTALNSLIWSHDLRQCYQSGSNSNRFASSSRDEGLRMFHKSFIEASSLNVILLAGRMAEAMALPAEAAGYQTTLHLRGCSFRSFLEVDKKKSEIKRIYIRLTSSLALTSRCDNWEEAKEHAEVFRFAATITKTANIHGFTIATRLVGKEIILRYWSEKTNLLRPMTIDSISPSMREWFALRGITTNEGIRQFERLGGSLAKGAFLLLCTLPRRKWGKRKQQYLKQDISKSAGKRVFSEDTIQRARELLTQLTGANPVVSYAEGSNMPKVPATSPLSVSEQDKGTIHQGDTSSSERHNDTTYQGDAFSSEDLDELFQDCKDCGQYSEELSLSNSDFHSNAPEPSYKLAEREDDERNVLLRGKFFKGHVYKKLGNHYQIWALKNMLTVRFSYQDVDLGEGFILKVVISPPGTRHPHIYATQANYDDPASRIAVEIKGIQNNGERFSRYVQQPEDGWKEPMRLNTVFDWFSGATLEQIAAKNQPRRYIYISQNDYLKSPVGKLSKSFRGFY
ncbi:hypothetical protein BDV26DRAFT_289654 [Aspergillus bertholletiae]|uniref:GIY-YIG domain-containing protein n=1 Tax=Aspergillus bertholletiae TaxID=1226010 RepID=A0A5N7BHU2_9EURO|nr:hypothetical protein BDV26DRAFT_289654 [Aspergillus bertholletiae]